MSTFAYSVGDTVAVYIITSPNHTRYRIIVSNGGSLSTELVT